MKSGIVIEVVSFHKEVIPSSLVLLDRLGVSNMHVLVNPEYMYDTANTCAQMGYAPKWTPYATGQRTYTKHAYDVVLFQSPEYIPTRVIQSLLPSNSSIVLLGCHNSPCKQLDKVHHPRKFVFHWNLRHPSFPPLYLPFAASTFKTRDVLMPGRIQSRRRNYDLIRLLPKHRRVTLFGEPTETAMVRKMKQTLPNVDFQSGNFSTLVDIAHHSSYIFIAPRSVQGYNPRKKMMSAVSLSVALGLIPIAPASILSSWSGSLSGFQYESIDLAFSANASQLEEMRLKNTRHREMRTGRFVSMISHAFPQDRVPSVKIVVPGHGEESRVTILSTSLRVLQRTASVSCIVYMYRSTSFVNQTLGCEVVHGTGLWTHFMKKVGRVEEPYVLLMIDDVLVPSGFNMTSFLTQMQRSEFDTASTAIVGQTVHDQMRPTKSCSARSVTFVDIMFTVFTHTAWSCWQKSIDISTNRYGWGNDITYPQTCSAAVGILNRHIVSHPLNHTKQGRTYDGKGAKSQMMAWLKLHNTSIVKGATVRCIAS